MFSFHLYYFSFYFRLVRKLVFVYFNVNVYLKEIPGLNKVTLPYLNLLVTNLQERCQEELSGEYSEPGFLLTKAFSVPLLCVSCALNPFLYAWRIPQYRQVLRLIGGWICQRFRLRSHTVNTLALNIPSVLASASLVELNTPAVGHLEKRRSEFAKRL